MPVVKVFHQATYSVAYKFNLATELEVLCPRCLSWVKVSEQFFSTVPRTRAPLTEWVQLGSGGQRSHHSNKFQLSLKKPKSSHTVHYCSEGSHKHDKAIKPSPAQFLSQ